MEMVIVPNALSDELYRVIDQQLENAPWAVGDREKIYHDLLTYYHEHGIIPDFTIQKPIPVA